MLIQMGEFSPTHPSSDGASSNVEAGCQRGVVGDYKIPPECHRHVPIDHLEMAFGITRVTPVTGAILHARDGRVGQVPAVGSERFCTTSRTATVLLMHALHEHSFPGLELATQKASQSTRSSESLHIEPSQALNFFKVSGCE